MFVSASHLTELPVDILEQIWLHLPGQDLIKMEVISRHFRDIVRDSPALQYRRKLFTAGLIENPSVSCDPAQRRKVCEEYVRKWSNSGRTVKSVYELPRELCSLLHTAITPGRNLLVFRGLRDHTLTFARVPTAASQKPIEWWTIPPFPSAIKGLATHLPDNVLAVAQEREQWIEIHILNLLDGSPYRPPPSNVIRWPAPPGIMAILVEDLIITSSRIMMYVRLWETIHRSSQAWWIYVWDWRTGNLVLNLSHTDERKLLKRNARVVFLDEFRMMVFTPDLTENPPEFMLFNTLVSQDDSRSLRRFRVPQRYRNWFPSVIIDRGMPLGTLNQDEPLIVDPAQAFIVIELFRGEVSTLASIVLRTQALIKHTCSMSTDTYIPWEEWGKDAMIIEIPTLHLKFYVQGAQMIEAKMRRVPGGGMEHICLRTFDFSKRGCSTLRSEGCEVVPAAWYENGRDLFLEGRGNVEEQEFDSLGNGTFCYLDRGPPDPMLHVWELV